MQLINFHLKQNFWREISMAKAKAKKATQVSSVKEAKTQILALTKDLFEARMKNSLGQLANPLVIRHTRREVARLKTFLNRKESAGR